MEKLTSIPFYLTVPSDSTRSRLLWTLLLIALLTGVSACSGGGGGGDDEESEAPIVFEDSSATSGPEDEFTPRSIRIMPIGDSLTEGQTGWNTYRFYLSQLLQTAALPVDFIGSREGVLGGGAPNPNFDQDHEGHWNSRSDEILEYGFETWGSAYPADIAILFAGISDMQQGRSVNETLTNLERIISLLRQSNPTVRVFLAQPPPVEGFTAEIAALNAAIPQLASLLSTDLSVVSAVDLFSGYSLETDTRDGVHPNDSGEQRIAQAFYNAIAPYLIFLEQESL